MNTLGLVPPIIWGLSVVGLRYGLYYNTLRGYKRRINNLELEIDKARQQLLGILPNSVANNTELSQELYGYLVLPAAFLAFNKEADKAIFAFFSALNGFEGVATQLKDFSRATASLRLQIKDYNRLALGKYDRRTAKLLGFKPIAVPV